MGWLILLFIVIGILAAIGNAIKNHNGMGKYADERLDKTFSREGGIIFVILLVLISIIIPNPYVIGVLFVFGIFFAEPISIYIGRKLRAKEAIKYDSVDSILEIVDNMNGQKFEEFLIKYILPSDGYINISGTKYSGDYGVDIIAEKLGIKCAIQCKRFNKNVNLKAVQEIVAGRRHYKYDKAIVITNNYFNDSAKKLADDNHVVLLDRDYLIKIIKNNNVTIEVLKNT